MLSLLPTNISPTLQKREFSCGKLSLYESSPLLLSTPPLPSCVFPFKYREHSAGTHRADQEYIVLQTTSHLELVTID